MNGDGGGGVGGVGSIAVRTTHLCCVASAVLSGADVVGGTLEVDPGNNTDPGSSLHVLWPRPWGRA
eukprot:6264443-Prymnesium_polylepis.1